MCPQGSNNSSCKVCILLTVGRQWGRMERTPALDSRTELLIFTQTSSSPLRHHHHPVAQAPALKANLDLSLFHTLHVQSIGKSCCLCLGNLAGICSPLSKPPPNSKPPLLLSRATPMASQLVLLPLLLPLTMQFPHSVQRDLSKI